MIRPRPEFGSDADWEAHVVREIEAARIRSDKKAEQEALAALTEAGKPAAAEKRPRAAKQKETR